MAYELYLTKSVKQFNEVVVLIFKIKSFYQFPMECSSISLDTYYYHFSTYLYIISVDLHIC